MRTTGLCKNMDRSTIRISVIAVTADLLRLRSNRSPLASPISGFDPANMARGLRCFVSREVATRERGTPRRLIRND